MALEVMFTSFFLVGTKPITMVVWAGLTDMGREIYRPEREIPIYAAGCVGALLLSLFVAGFGVRRGQIAPQQRNARWFTLLVVAVLGAAAYCAAGIFGGWRPDGVPLSARPPEAVSGCLALTAAILVFQAACLLSALRRGPDHPSDPGRSSDITPTAPPFGIADAAVIAGLILLTFAPDGHRFAGVTLLSDGFHHWNYFLIAPAIGFLHGKALGTEVYSQYGVGWSLLAAAVNSVAPLSYSRALGLLSAFSAAYFALAYIFLRSVTGSRPLAALGALAAAYLQQFVGLAGAATLWQYPSSTVLRSPLDIALLLTLWQHLRTRRPVLLAAAGAISAAALLLETDTGIYLLVTLAVYGVAYLRLSGQDACADGAAPWPRRAATLLRAWAGGFAPVFLAGMAVASRGTLLRPEFWRGWLECLLLYPSGMSFLPITSNAETFLPAFFIFGCLLFILCRNTARLRQGMCSPYPVLALTLAVYGLCYNLQFVGRSHPANLFHCIVPLVLALVVETAPTVTHLWNRARVPVRVAAAGAAACLTGILAAGNVGLEMHPSLLSGMLPSGSVVTLFQAFHYGHGGADVSIDIDAAGQPDVLLPTSQSPRALRFQAATEELRRRAAHGERVAVLSNDDTTLYFAAGVAPWDRYSPLLPLLLDWNQEARVRSRLERGEADAVLITRRETATAAYPDTRDVLEALRAVLHVRYHKVAPAGDYDVYVHTPAPAVLGGLAQSALP